MTTIGIIGAGHIGSALARAFSELGYDVVIANSRGPETLTDVVAGLGPKVTAASAADAAAAADIAVVTVPLKALKDVPVEPLAGKFVIDTNNYYFERDGHIEALDRGETTTSQLVQDHLPTSKVVKGFNQILASDINTTGLPAGSADRRALGTASDHDDAVELITGIYDALGYDTVSAGPLSESWRLERDRPAYVTRQNADELRANLAKANRLP
ncbi:NAD(P)-binding domain-containing protein [Microbacterium sp. NEAU-LLC]|uniref:NAD(P)-binding domain-containing protein n=1 Tax=Microbacterium helvum TaxID=2773713 RepID=A0ABR8NIL7_9MICO|nr:NAD(P)-binding domain-containing protein [Microbacterium helvum]MBD3940530.1 NAD(P)-binding domain-containing protein [Microbacterium helvum]